MRKIDTRPGYKIVYAGSGKPCPVGTALRAVDPVAQPHTWRLDAHHCGEDDTAHRVTVSRHHPKFGRIKRTFHPRVFGLTVEVEVTWYRATGRKVRHAWHETYVGIYLGFLALIGLAFFEQYHLAPEITGTLLSIFGGGGGGH